MDRNHNEDRWFQTRYKDSKSNGGRKVDEAQSLSRFVRAQENVIATVRDELRRGQKITHWMWFIFPQVSGLGSSAMAARYAINSIDEAKAYADHPVLGPRLRDCTALVNAVSDRSVRQIFGSPDDMKFHSSMTLFATVQPEEIAFSTALNQYFGGRRDENTMERLAAWGANGQRLNSAKLQNR